MYCDFIRIHSGPVTNKEAHNCKRYDSTGSHIDWIPVLSTLTIRFQFRYISLAGGDIIFFLLQCWGHETSRQSSYLHNITTLKHPKSSNQHHSHRIHVWYIYLHLVDFYDKCRLIFHTWILWDSQKEKLNSPGHFRSHTAWKWWTDQSQRFSTTFAASDFGVVFWGNCYTLFRFEVLVCLENCDSQMLFPFSQKHKWGCSRKNSSIGFYWKILPKETE